MTREEPQTIMMEQYVAQSIVTGRANEVQDAALRRELQLERREARRERRRLRGF